MTRALLIVGTITVVIGVTWGPTIWRTIRRHYRGKVPVRLLVPVLIFATMFFLSAAGSVSFFVTIPILVVMLVVAANWRWLDRIHQRNAPPASHPVHRRAGQPWTPWSRDDALDMSPQGWDALETLLADEDSLAQAEAAEQEARRASDSTNEGNHHDREH